MAANDLYKVVLSHTYQGVLCQNVLYFRAKVNGLDAQQLCGSIKPDWQTWITQSTVAQCSFNSVYAQVVSSLQADAFTLPVVPVVNGALTGQGMPPQSACVVTLRTGFYGRSKRGRLYHFGWPVSWLTNGSLNSQMISTIDTFWAGFFNKYKKNGSNANWEFGVYSKKLGGYNIPYNLSGYTAYTEYFKNAVVGTERGRKQ